MELLFLILLFSIASGLVGFSISAKDTTDRAVGFDTSNDKMYHCKLSPIQEEIDKLEGEMQKVKDRK